MDHETLEKKIEQLARTIDDQRFIGMQQIHELAEAFGSVRDIELAALDRGVVPFRYARNLGSVGLEGQRKLLLSTVAVVGLGGLGGYVVEALARMGVGRLILIDGDTFEEHNLNRQLLSTLHNQGLEKARAACQRVAAINAAVETTCHAEMLTQENLPQLLDEADVVVDALDRLPTRLMLQDGVQRLGIPLVHGSIAGFLGQVMTILPGDAGLHGLYGDGEDIPERGLESELGTPAATPMAVAAWEAQEVVKFLTDQGTLLRNRLLVIDTGTGDSRVLAFG